ncbi:MAG: COX15/CtaA family protein, partial [Hyphomicrobiaceae bacterium]
MMRRAATIDTMERAAAVDADRAVRAWLIAVVVLVVLMVTVGGATRLTGSGLSITEWKPIMGAIPPLGEAAWFDAFAKYKTIPQYAEVNKGMSLDAFK